MNKMEHIRKKYGVPAQQRMRVTIIESGRRGVITGAYQGWLMIRADGDDHSVVYHPSRDVDYTPIENRPPRTLLEPSQENEWADVAAPAHSKNTEEIEG